MKRRRIGIYNRDITNGGGAEKRTAVMAERLSRVHDVTLVVSGPCPLNAIEAYFAVDLSRVKVAQLSLPGHDLLRRMVDAVEGPLLQRARARPTSRLCPVLLSPKQCAR
jgi:hypothetical protein